jgi:2-desacetyl-2-hydroxyethyl bacteriochlorophyllide A dehydrogenase
MKRLAVQFTAPYKVTAQEEPAPSLSAGEVLVKTLVSAISPGTEMLVYRGEWPANTPVDETIPSLRGGFTYPLKYGYATVGRVISLGHDAPPDWLGKTVFSFHPHESLFTADPQHLIPIPEALTPEDACFLPNMETAVSLVMDGRPMIGERVVVLGQGVVGLLTTSLLGLFPLASLIALDKYPVRREKALFCGAHTVLDPSDPQTVKEVNNLLESAAQYGGADLVYEISGNPVALDQAIGFAGYSGRIVVGSWYGAKRVDVDLGGRFHRNRIRIISSQVSRLEPCVTNLWDKSRRLLFALKMLEYAKPNHLTTHRIPIREAAEAYRILDQQPDRAIQILLTYEDN